MISHWVLSNIIKARQLAHSQGVKLYCCKITSEQVNQFLHSINSPRKDDYLITKTGEVVILHGLPAHPSTTSS